MNQQSGKSCLTGSPCAVGESEGVITKPRTNTSGQNVARNTCHRFMGGWCGVALLGATLLSGHAVAASEASASKSEGTAVTVTDTRHLTRSGFLSNYDRLKKADWGNGIECWRDAGLDAKKYDKVMISRILVSLKPKAGEEAVVDPSELKKLTDYFNDSMVKALKPQMAIVTAPEPGTILIGIALTHLKPTKVGRSVSGTLIPFGFVAEAGSGVATGGPAGSTPYLGETGMEMQFLDATSGAVLGECRDTTVGRKYAAEMDSSVASTWANGYMNSFQAWSYAKNAFDKWSMLVAKRFAELRGVTPAK
jgi:hypothetical protein